jgi:hypothetical protein
VHVHEFARSRVAGKGRIRCWQPDPIPPRV